MYAAHVRYYTDFAVRSLAALQGEKQRGWLRAVTANLANLRVRTRRVGATMATPRRRKTIAGCLGWYWWFTGRALEGSQWLALARSCPGPVRSVTGRACHGMDRVHAHARIRALGRARASRRQRGKPRRTELLDDDEIDALCARGLRGVP